MTGNAAGWTLWYRSESAKREQAAVRRIALRFSHNLVTFDYRTLDADVKRIQDDSTGRFHTELETALGGGVGVFKDVLVEAQSKSSGKVHRAVVLSIEGSTARVFAQLDQTIRNKESPEPRTVTRTLDITLVKTDKGWKVDGVKAEGGESP